MPGSLSSLVALITKAKGGVLRSAWPEPSWDSRFRVLTETVLAVGCYM